MRDEEIDKRFYKDKDLKEIQAHPLQFTVWRYSGKSRIIVEFFATLIIAIIMHVVIDRVLVLADNMTNEMNTYVTLENRIRALTNGTNDPLYSAYTTDLNNYYKQIRPDIEVFFTRVMLVSYLSFPCLLFAF